MILLGSGSIRRKELLTHMQIPFTPFTYEHIEDHSVTDFILDPEKIVSYQAMDKMLHAASQLLDIPLPANYIKTFKRRTELEFRQRTLREFSKRYTHPKILLTADTIVHMDGLVFNKPKDTKDAFNMLEQLSDSSHIVTTSVVLMGPRKDGNSIFVSFSESTKVTFYPLSEKDISAYIKTNEPFDKAGGYGIQGIGGLFVKKICGSYTNVVGLPIEKFVHILETDFLYPRHSFIHA